jgi:hypothetical protein
MESTQDILEVVQKYNTEAAMTTATTELPQMQEHLFFPWYPLPTGNECPYGKHREDLPNDAQVHLYNDAFWTTEELYELGALPPRSCFCEDGTIIW